MSSASATPITPEAFALAIKDLPASTLHCKVLEIRNSIAHLDYSNQQLLPYTDGTNGEPDPDCADAIKENEVVIERHNERLGLLKIEVEQRGLNWREFSTTQELEEQEENEAESETNGDMVDGNGNLVNGFGHGPDHGNASQNVTSQGMNGTTGVGAAAASSQTTSSPWADGTFTTGRINNGVFSFDHTERDHLVISRVPPINSTTSNLTRQLQVDAEITRLIRERMEEDIAAEDGDGVHL